MKLLRGVSALLALLALVVGAPALLIAAWRPPDLSGGWNLLLTPDDGRLLTTVIVIVGWGAWLVFVASLGIELTEMLSRGRIRVGVRGLRVPRVLAAALVGAIVAVATVRTLTPLGDAPPPVAASTFEAPPSVAATPETAPDADDDSAHVHYTVQQGDDLWSLADTFYGQGARWPQIVQANAALDPRQDLTPGQVLRIPASPAGGFAAAPQAPAPTGPAPAATVTVQDGDTLWAIAERTLGAGDQWPRIFALNRDRIADPDSIDVGWVLRLPDPASSQTAPSDKSGTQSTVPEAPDESSQTDTEPSTSRGTSRDADSHPAPRSDSRPGSESSGSDDEFDVVAGESSAHAALLLGGLGPLLAASVCGALAGAREVQRWGRPAGRRYASPPDRAVQLQGALIAAADRPGQSLLDDALCLIGQHCRTFGVDLPPLSEVVVEEDNVAFRFATPPPTAPDGFTERDNSWTLTSEAWRAAEVVPGPSPYPALVTLGRASTGPTHLANLLATPVLGITGPAATVDAVTDAWTLELATATWTQDLQLCVESPLDRVLSDSDRELVVADAPRLVEELEQMSTARRQGLPPHGLPDIWPAAVFLFRTPLPGPLRERVRSAASADVGIAAVLAHCPSETTWTLTGDIDPRGRLGLDGTPLAAQHLTGPTRDALVDLRDAADSAELLPAPWWDHGDDDAASPPDPPRPIVRQEPAVLVSEGPLHPLLNLLGPIELLGTTGNPPTRGQRTCMEYCGWLLEHPGSTAPAMASSLLVAESSRRSTVSRLRTWIGKSPSGDAYLPEAYSGRIWLHPGVSSDWQQLQILIAPGVNRTSAETLETALGMVRGAVLADAAPGQWSWAEELRVDIMATIRDIALELTRVALSEGKVDLARWATARALTVSPEDEQLLCARIHTERRIGNHREVERLALKTTAHARRLGIDLSPDTVRLLQEVMEGRIRARSVLS